MQSGIFKQGLSKLLDVCRQNGFFHAVLSDSFPTSFTYGALGSLLRRNIKREWLFSILSNNDAHLFAIEVQVRNETRPLPIKSVAAASLWMPDVIKNYFEILPSLQTDIPCGFAAYGSHFELEEHQGYRDELFTGSFLQNCHSRYNLGVAFFCSSKMASHWFSYWCKLRYRWWRKYSSLPSKFFMSEVIETPSGDQQLTVLMDFPWGKEKLETITLLGDASCHHFSNVKEAKKSEMPPTLIVCQSDLDLALFAYLTNAFAEKWRNDATTEVIQLDVKLAPYKVALVIYDDGDSDVRKMKDIANHLGKELKKSQVTVFPVYDCCKDVSSQLKKFDGMGIPYSIILEKASLLSGVATLRNRDSTLKEQVHFVDLASKVMRYLEMKPAES